MYLYSHLIGLSLYIHIFIITFRSNPTLALEMQEELLNHELDNILRTKQLKK